MAERPRTISEEEVAKHIKVENGVLTVTVDGLTIPYRAMWAALDWLADMKNPDRVGRVFSNLKNPEKMSTLVDQTVEVQVAGKLDDEGALALGKAMLASAVVNEGSPVPTE